VLSSRTPIFNKEERGFTLIEVIVVLFFMVVAASIVVPRFGDYQKASQAKDAARNIASYIREARDLAIEQQRNVMLEPGGNGNALIARYDDTTLPVGGAANSSMSQNTSGQTAMPPIFFPDTLKAEINPVSQATDTSMPEGLSFTPDGHAPDVNVIVLYAPERGYRISVRRQGTRVRIEDANSPDTFPSPTTLNNNTGGAS
jgi:prepilin-type N-terminal cleavage/methylation domain-containing protein